MWSHGGWNGFIRANENSYTTTRNDAENPVRTPQKTPVVLENQLILCQFLFGQKIAAQSFCGIADFPICAQSERTLLGHRMGVGASVDLAVPPGGSTLVLMNPTECFQTKPKIDSTQKPLCLSMLGDAEWNEWMGKFAKHCESIFEWDAPLLLGTPCFCCCHRHHGLPGYSNLCHVSRPLPFFFIIAGSRFFIVWRNQGRGMKTEGCILGACCQEISCIINVPLFHSKTCWNRHISFQKRPGTFCSPKDCWTKLVVSLPGLDQ